jgi:hypothetical protein
MANLRNQTRDKVNWVQSLGPSRPEDFFFLKIFILNYRQRAFGGAAGFDTGVIYLLAIERPCAYAQDDIMAILP